MCISSHKQRQKKLGWYFCQAAIQILHQGSEDRALHVTQLNGAHRLLTHARLQQHGFLKSFQFHKVVR